MISWSIYTLQQKINIMTVNFFNTNKKYKTFVVQPSD